MFQRLLPMLRLKTTKRLFLVGFLFLSLSSLPNLVLAQEAELAKAPMSFGLLVAIIFQWIFGIIGLVVFSIVCYAGYLWMSAGGDEIKIEKAKDIMKNALIALSIVLIAFLIATFVRMALGRQVAPPDDGVIANNTEQFIKLGLGGGSIVSVYPSPGQKGVSIDTWLVVTFKLPIQADTICQDVNGDGQCNGEVMTDKVDWCQINDDNTCIPGSGFATSDFASSTVYSLDNTTFVFSPNKYLGNTDKETRKFKVTLRKGILSRVNKEDVLAKYGLTYSWSFETNGQLDLDPPQVVSAGFIPAPDDQVDEYYKQETSSPTVFVFEQAKGAVINKKVEPSFNNLKSLNEKTPKATLSGTYSGPGDGVVKVQVLSSNGQGRTLWPSGITPTEYLDVNYKEADTKIDIGPQGLEFKLTGQAVRGAEWSFNVVSKKEGDRIQLSKNNEVLKTYTFDQISSTTSLMIEKIIKDNPELLVSCGKNCIATKQAGINSGAYDLKFFIKNTDQGDDNILKINKTPGEDAAVKARIKGIKDVYRNQIFQITFNKAINPLAAKSSVVGVRFDQTNKNNLESINNVRIALANQYQTMEILPPAEGKYECGKNACGDTIYCWPVNSIIDKNQDGRVDNNDDYANKGTKYQLILNASTLKTCSSAQEGWCVSWGGVCDNNKKCSKKTGISAVNYPKSGLAFDGLMDMAGNSFNGNYSTTTYNGEIVGSSEGKSLPQPINQGGSGLVDYILNANSYKTNNNIIYQASTTQGDSLIWNFWVSDQIDRQAPVITKVYPIGDANVANLTEPILATFDRLMRATTLKPGWNYGDIAKDKSERFIALNTIDTNAEPVGYWIDKEDVDNNNDGAPEFTVAKIQHESFTRNIRYSPLIGSGVESLMQNCFLPGAGPAEAGVTGKNCAYSGDDRKGCSPVTNDNPASYAFMACENIVMNFEQDRTAVKCDMSNECKVSYFDEKDFNSSSTDSTNKAGSWIVTKDFANIIGGKTGCCLGRCVSADGKIVK